MKSEKIQGMKKKIYSSPEMDIVTLSQQQPLLTGSYDGPANAPEMGFGVDDTGIGDVNDVTFTDDNLEFFE